MTTSSSGTNVHSLFKGINSEMELLLALGEHISTEFELEALLKLVAESAREVIDAKTLTVPIIDFEKNEYTYLSAAGENADLIVKQSFPLSVGMCGWVLTNRKPLLFGHQHDLPMGKKTVWEKGMESALLVPLISRGKIIGGLSGLGKNDDKSFTRRDLELLTLFANQTSIAVENAQVLKQLNEQQEKLEQVLETTRFEKELAEVTLEAIPEGVVITDKSRTIVNVNSAAEVLMDCKRRDLIGKSIENISITGWSDEYDGHPLTRALEDDCMVRIPDGKLETNRRKQIQVEGSVSLMRDENFHSMGAVMLLRDVTSERQMVEKIHHYATYDQLTGLINRREFENRLQHAIDSAFEQNKVHALCYIDLDQFKIVNDTCGHVAGDELLRQLGVVLNKSVRERDTLARIGGDEFGLLLENCSLDNAIKIAESIRQHIEDFHFVSGNKKFRISASIGLVSINSLSGSINTVLSAADQACYASKETGRNRIKIFTEADEHLILRSSEMHWVSRLHDALAQNHFQLYYQPIARISQDKPGEGLEYYELLLRLKQDDDEVLPPGSFLPAAERYGLISEIDRWVIRNYFEWISRHREHLKKLHRCSINLSGQSLGDGYLFDYIFEQMNIHNVPGEKLCFEITETAAIANLSDAMSFISSMQKLGVQFSLDDFGTGMSSFSYLKALPIDNLKIDGSFVKDVLTDEVDASLVKTIVEISKTMKMNTIAEFVENDDILKRITQLGVDYAQGYGIARPQQIDGLLQ